MTTGTEMETVPRETSALLLTPPEGTPTTPVDVDVLADARARSWAPNTRRAYGRQLAGLHQLVLSIIGATT